MRRNCVVELENHGTGICTTEISERTCSLASFVRRNDEDQNESDPQNPNPEGRFSCHPSFRSRKKNLYGRFSNAICTTRRFRLGAHHSHSR